MCARLLFPELFAAIHHKILRKFRHLFGRFDKTVVNPLFEKGFDTCDKVDAVIVAITGIVVFGTDYPAVETEFLPMTVEAPSSLDLNRNIILTFEEPIAHIDTSAIHMTTKVDSLWEDIPFIFRADANAYRRYEILADWKPGMEYQLTIDSLGFKGIYGLSTNKTESTLKVKTLEDYGTLYLNIIGADSTAIVQLLNGNDQVLREQPVSKQNTCDFYFLQPNTKYYLRLFIDRNKNGKWDTGNYEQKIPPEEVFYFPKVWEMKANFEFEETWDIHATPLDKQKLDEIKKQKPDETKKIRDRNKERAQKLGRT